MQNVYNIRHMRLPRIFKRKHSIANRLTWRVVGVMILVWTILLAFIFAIIGLVGMVFLLIVNRSGMQVSHEQINNVFSNVEVALTNNVPEVEDNIGKELRQYFAQENLLALNPNISGAAVAYNPNYEPMKGQPYSPYAYRDSLGTHTKQLNTEAYDYLHQEWYTKPLEQGKGVWSEPYIDTGGGGIPMITYSLPLINNNGEVYAIQTADVSLDWLSKLTQKMDSTFINNFATIFTDEEEERHSIYSFIISSKGTFIAHPDKKLLLNTNIYEFLKREKVRNAEDKAQKLLSDESGTIGFKDSADRYFIVYYSPIERTGWHIGVVVPRKYIVQPVLAFLTFCLLLMIVGLVIIALVCRRTIRRVTKPLRRFADSADEIAKGNFQAELPRVKTKDEMLRLRNSFETMPHSLVRQIEETKAVNEEKGRMESELYIARNIQMSMLPKVYPPYPERNDIDIYGQLIPAKEVGGDLYDFYIRDEKLFFCIGDVSGKGVPAALVMAVTRTMFRTSSLHESQPERIMAAVNNAINNNNDSIMFVTMFIGVLDLPTGRLRYCNGGHNSPMLIGDNGVSMLSCLPNIPIGITSDWKFTPQDTMIDPQTTIFLYTDGLTEAENIRHEQFQEERMMDLARQTYRQPQTLTMEMTEAIRRFVGGAEQNDDQTILAIQYTYKQQDMRLERSITLPNDIEEVPQLAAFVDEVCEALDLDMSTTASLNLAMEEAVVNVMTYAYPKGTKGKVDIEAKADDKKLKFIISDNGAPFDPTEQKEADTTLSAEERPIGGLGIHLVRQMMDSINYERTNGKNILTLIKHLMACLLLFITMTTQAQDKFIFSPQWTAQAQFAGYYVAQEKGFYKEAGLDVEIVHPSVSQSAISRIRNNESHATTLQLAEAMDIIDHGIPLVNILQTSMNNALVIVSRWNKNPLKQKGAKVGIWQAGFGQLAICMSMREGMNYQWIPYASNTNLFVAGAIDAILAMCYNEYYQLLQTGISLNKDNVYRLCDHGYNVQEDGVYMTRSYYESHRDQARRFAAASKKGWLWAAAHLEETLEIVMKYVRKENMATNRVLQDLMLKEVLRLQIDRDSKKREFRLRPDMVKFASKLMRENLMLSRDITYEEIIGK